MNIFAYKTYEEFKKYDALLEIKLPRSTADTISQLTENELVTTVYWSFVMQNSSIFPAS